MYDQQTHFILNHSAHFDGVIYEGYANPSFTRSDNLAKYLLSIHKVLYSQVNDGITPVNSSIALIYTDRLPTCMTTIDPRSCLKEKSRQAAMKSVIYRLIVDTYGFKEPRNIIVNPIGIVMDFTYPDGKEGGGKFYLSESFRPTHSECITLDRRRIERLMFLLRGEYIKQSKRTEFIGHKIFDMEFYKENEEAQ